MKKIFFICIISLICGGLQSNPFNGIRVVSSSGKRETTPLKTPRKSRNFFRPIPMQRLAIHDQRKPEEKKAEEGLWEIIKTNCRDPLPVFKKCCRHVFESSKRQSKTMAALAIVFISVGAILFLWYHPALGFPIIVIGLIFAYYFFKNNSKGKKRTNHGSKKNPPPIGNQQQVENNLSLTQTPLLPKNDSHIKLIVCAIVLGLILLIIHWVLGICLIVISFIAYALFINEEKNNSNIKSAKHNIVSENKEANNASGNATIEKQTFSSSSKRLRPVRTSASSLETQEGNTSCTFDIAAAQVSTSSEASGLSSENTQGEYWYQEGMLYCNGNDGREIDYKKSAECFEKSKNHGYSAAAEALKALNGIM